VREGKNGGERPCSALFYLHSPPPRSSLLPHPQPHVLLRFQRRAPATAAAAVSTGQREGGREIEEERRWVAAALLGWEGDERELGQGYVG
jgi:hypothetical protein